MAKKFSLILILILVLSFSLIALSYRYVDYHKNADEGFYLSYPKFLEARGLSGYPELFKKYIYTREMWIFPNPLRAGFFLISLLWLKLTGFTLFSLSCFSTLFFILFLAVSFFFSRKYLSEDVALLYTLLLAFSPLNMAMATRALSESAVLFTSASSVWLFWDYLQKRSSRSLVLLIISLTLAIMFKESSVIISIIFAGFLILEAIRHRRRFSFTEFLLIGILPFVIFSGLILALGGAPYFLRTAHIILTSPRINYYAIFYGRGPWHRYLVDYLAISPWIFILAAAFIFRFLLSVKRDKITAYLLIFSLAFFCLFNLFTKNIRYVALLDVPIRFFALLMVKGICERFFPKAVLPAMLVFVLFLGAADYLAFHTYFIQGQIYDPSSASLFNANHMVPQLTN